MTATDDHGTLPAHSERLLARLEGLERLHAYDGIQHMQHMEFAKRARQLAGQLRSVILLNKAFAYPSALIVVRAVLEHHLMDRLLFLATRYVETYGGIRRDDVAAEEARLAKLQAGPRPDIERWWWDDSGMNVVIRGIHTNRSKKGRGMIISPYYFRMDDFDPFTGGKRHARKLASPFWNRDHREEWANASHAAWRRYFVHDRILKGLTANRLLPGRLALQVDVHYAFLSGFAHPTKRGYEAVYGTNYPDDMGSFNHFASELGLLYVITLAAAEIETYGRMARRAPRLGLRGWSTVESEVSEARAASDYFWFLGGQPTMLDRIDTIHTPVHRSRPRFGRPRRDPATIRTESVRYYADPLDRIKRLHQSWQEMSTGLVHRSMFDAPT